MSTWIYYYEYPDVLLIVLHTVLLFLFCLQIHSRYASNGLVQYMGREERRFQRCIEDTFAMKVQEAKVAKENYELALKFHVDRNIGNCHINASLLGVVMLI